MSKKISGAAVITGAGGGIGRGLALKAASAGYEVAVLDIDADAASRVASEIVAHDGKAIWAKCDVALAEDVLAAVEAIERARLRLRLVWANAGVAHLGGIVSGPEMGFDWIYSVNVQGTINTLRTFVPILLEEDGDRHIGVTASVAGLTRVGALTPAYGASKYAMIGLAEALRAELAPAGIGVTIACPGLVHTGIWDGARVRPDRFGGAFAAPYALGERHRTKGLPVAWAIDRIWEQVEAGGGYVSPVTGIDVIDEYEQQSAEARASFRVPGAAY